MIEFLDWCYLATDKELRKKFQQVPERQEFTFKLKTKLTRSVVEKDDVIVTSEPSKVRILVFSCKGHKALHATCLMER